jgi:hypothetical protein
VLLPAAFNPNSPLVANIARSYLEAGRLEVTLDRAYRAIAAQPEVNVSGYCLAGASLARLGRIEEAGAITAGALER